LEIPVEFGEGPLYQPELKRDHGRRKNQSGKFKKRG